MRDATFKRWKRFLGKSEILDTYLHKSLLYTNTFVEDIYPNVPIDVYNLVVDASVGLLIHIKLLDNLIDSPTDEAKRKFLAFSELLCSSKCKFAELFAPLFSKKQFGEIWSIYVGRSVSSISKRFEGRLLEPTNIWEMSAFISLTPYSILVAKNLVAQSNVSDVIAQSELWQEIIKHTFTAKQIIDDLIDLQEDLGNQTITPITFRLKNHSGHTKFISELEASIKDSCEQASSHFKIAVEIASKIEADGWKRLCINWLVETQSFMKSS